MGQICANATKAENQTIVEMSVQQEQSAKAMGIEERDTPAQCGPGVPCSDGSCCNSVRHGIAFQLPWY
jgi:hypothetical protein